MTGSNTDLRAKFRAAFLAFVMVTSVMGATVAFSGSAVAAVADTSTTGNQPADIPGDTSGVSQELAPGDSITIGTSAGGTASVIIDLSPLTNAGVDISNADVSASADTAASNAGDAVDIDRLENGEIHLKVSDASAGDGKVVLDSLTLTGLDTTGVDTASGLSYLIQVDDGNNGNFGSGFTVDASAETGEFNIATIEVENVATGNTVTETSMSAAITEANSPGANDVGGSSSDQIVIRPNTGTYTFDSQTISASNTRIEPLGDSDVTFANGNAGQTLTIGAGVSNVEISGITFDQQTNADDSAIVINDNANNVDISGNTFTNVADDDDTNVIDIDEGAEAVTIENGDFTGGDGAAEAIDVTAGGTGALDLTVTNNNVTGFDNAVVLSNAIQDATVTNNNFESNDIHVDDNAGVTTLNDVFANNDFAGKYVTIENSNGDIIDAVFGKLSAVDTDIDGADGRTVTIAGQHSANSIVVGQADDLTVTAAGSGATVVSNGNPVFDLTDSDDGSASNIEISGLTFDLSAGGHTAIIDGGDDTYDGVTVTNNEFSGADQAVIDLGGTHSALGITQNTFDSDSNYRAVDLQDAGFSGSDTIQVNNNDINDADVNAIDLDVGSANLNVEVNDNTITNQSGGDAIEVSVTNGNDVAIEGNTLTGENDGAGVGIDLDGDDADGSIVSVSNNDVSQFDDESGGGVGIAILLNDVTVQDNVLENNAEHFHDESAGDNDYDLSTITSQNTLNPVVRVLDQEGGSVQNDKLYGTIEGANIDAGNEYIKVGAGTYDENSILVDSGVTIDGNGQATVTTDTANPIFDVDDHGSAVVIKGFNFEAQNDNGAADIKVTDADADVTIEENTFAGPGTTSRQGVLVKDIETASTLSVQDNEFSNYAEAVQVDDDTDSAVAYTIDVVRNEFTSNGLAVDLVDTEADNDDIVRIHFNDIAGNSDGVSIGDDANGDNTNTHSIRANWWGSETGPGGDFNGDGDTVIGDNAGDTTADPWLEQSFTQLSTNGYVVITDPVSPVAGDTDGDATDNEPTANVLVATLNDTAANGEDETTTALLSDPAGPIAINELAGSASAANPIQYEVQASESGDYTLTARNTDGNVQSGSAVQSFTGTPTDVEVTVDRDTLVADDQTTVNATLTLVDANGNAVVPPNANYGVSWLIENGSAAGVTRIVAEDLDTDASPDSKARLEISADTAGETLTITGVWDQQGFSDTATVETVNQQMDVSVSPQTVTANNSTQVTVDVTNAQTGAAVEDASVELSGAGVSQTVLTDADGTATATVNASSAGSIDVSVTADGYADATASVTVEAAADGGSGNDSPLSGAAGEYDGDGDGKISTNELSTAVLDYGSDQLTTSELSDIIIAYGSS